LLKSSIIDRLSQLLRFFRVNKIMASQSEPLILFYELAGPKSWSPFCWHTRFVLNYKGIPFKTIKLSYPDIKPKIEELFGPDFEAKGLEATVPIIQTLPTNIHNTPPQALNDSIPIARFLNKVFTPELGFKHLEGVEEVIEYEKKLNELKLWRPLMRWIVYDVWAIALKGDERSQEFFRRTREESFCRIMGKGVEPVRLEDVVEKSGGEEKILEGLRVGWVGLKERMAKEDGSGEPTNVDFYDAGLLKWVEAASTEKLEKILNLYGDDTFIKLRKKTEKYASQE